MLQLHQFTDLCQANLQSASVYLNLEGEIYKFLRSQHSIIPVGMKYMCALARTVEFRSQFGLITQIGKC